ncbi:glycoside hydrolase family 26 protein [Nocardioides panaciterrulae]|uniref:GH26 domain-containing protein n=1 Tax=Nocardioides panaciterrulae TaxID=661492 RepID=A0A7Y9E3M6_9ACTN|nr:glycosyl hydrolase [Nocardioides panaciterrulae]NYD40422.1 hypothetical protein [Nocardioides panaciterrulae]
MASRVLVPWLVCALLALVGCDAGSSSGSDVPTAREARGAGSSIAPASVLRPAAELVPPRGEAWFGASIDWSRDSLAAYADRLGRTPAVAVGFYQLPMRKRDRTWLDQAVTQARAAGTMLLVTLEPRAGLGKVTQPVVEDLARLLDGYNRQGTPVFLRFAHEMNGSWYPWGQQPQAYVSAFRRVADAVHRWAPGTAMVWAPNYGGGYPFAGGRYAATPGSAAARALDTDGDGRVTQSDDPYAPYWPGRRYVDWVGMSIYHWGAAYPWGENEIPEPGKFTDLLRGTYDGAAGDERAVPDFYAVYGERQRLPVAVTETGALYAPGRGGADELAIKQAWWRQVFAADHAQRLPWVKMVNWFEWRKQEPEIGGIVDWTSTHGIVGRAFCADLPTWLRFADS